MSKFKVRYAIHTGISEDGFISSGECEIEADTLAEAKTKAEKHIENNDSHFDPRIHPFIEIQNDWIEELEKPLNTETNTPAMEKRILAAAQKSLRRRNLSAFFEHGHWWITHQPSGAQWSVCDASGPTCPDGFDFEQVTPGDDD